MKFTLSSVAKTRNGKKYKGVYFQERCVSKPWCARLNTKEKSIHIGYFATELEAAKAYNKVAYKHFKDYSWLNKIEGAKE